MSIYTPLDAVSFGTIFIVAVLAFCVTATALFGPFRALILGRHPRIDTIISVSNAKVAIMLIHGTFARQAPWTGGDHKLCRGLKEGLKNACIYRLVWSGDNSHHQRLRAAKELAGWIITQSKARRIYLIGHSHGGLIAALSATISSDERVYVITLATPFINISKKYAGVIRTRKAHGFASDEDRLFRGLGFYCCLFLLALTTVSSARALWLFPLIGIPLVVFVLGWKLPAITSYVTSKADEFYSDSRISLPKRRLFIVRATADEASGFLAFGQMLSWILIAFVKPLSLTLATIIRLEATITTAFGRFVNVGLFFGILGLLNSCGMLFPAFFKYTFWGSIILLLPMFFLRFHLLSLIIEPLLLAITAVASFLCHLPFGIELALASLVVGVSVEAAPIGQWNIMTVASSGAVLAHSYLYDSDEVTKLVASIEADLLILGL
jgi:pimeloyl-ACP methyl ester carboxylesterase